MKSFINRLKRIWENKILRAVTLAGPILVLTIYILVGLRGLVFVPNVLYILGFEVRLYSLLMLLALLVAVLTARHLRSIDDNLAKIDLWEILFYLLVPGIIGARVYFVATEWPLFELDPASIFQLWGGGMSIIGGVIGGALGLVIYARQMKVPTIPLAAAASISLLAGQVVGRLGNFFNRELYGLPTDLPWGLYIEPAFRLYPFQSFDYFHPLFLYEILLNICLLLFIYWYWRRIVMKPSSEPTRQLWRYTNVIKAYIVGYGAIRFVLDFLRLENRGGVGLFTYTQILFMLMMMAIVLIGVFFQLWHYHQHNTFFKRENIND